MRKRIVRRISVLAVAALIGGVGASVPARADDTTGSIVGQFTNSHGQPITNASVQVWDATNWSTVAYASTDANGDYEADDIQPGSYFVEFDFSGLTLYSGNAVYLGEGKTYEVTAGGTTTVDDQALATATLTGTLTNSDGTPAAGVGIGDQSDAFPGISTTTDDGGAWSLLVFAPASYYISYALPNGLTQWSGGDSDINDAVPVSVTADQTRTVNDAVLPTGTISGRYTDANGQPVAGAQVTLSFPLTGNTAAQGTTDDNGDYSVPTFAGKYTVQFASPDGLQQFAYGALDPQSATLFAVTAEHDTEVDDSELGTGTVTVTGVNAKTGVAVKAFCVYVDSQYVCTKNGTAVVPNVRQGNEQIQVTATNPKYIWAAPQHVAVVAGQNVAFQESFQPGTLVKTTIVDSTTGAPVAGACVLAFVPGYTVWPDGGGSCSDDTGAITIGPLAPGYSDSLFVTAPYQSAYGDQWVGADGHGTGMEQNALVIKATAGKTVTIGNIQMDQAGSLTGTVTDKATGLPIKSAGVGRNTFSAGSGAAGDIVATDASGRYTLTNLGPYQWPIFTNANGYASQWSGGVGNRYAATTVQITSGATATYNVAMSAGPHVTGTVSKSDGTPLGQAGMIAIYNAKTGDTMGFTWSNPDGSFSLPAIGKQNVRIEYWFQDLSGTYDGWYGGPTEAQAQVVYVSKAGATVNIVLQPGTGQ